MIEFFKKCWLKVFKANEKDPRNAYNKWAMQYDNQPGNLMLELDAEIFDGFIDKILITGKKVVDIGCGTGRHWKKILAKNPEKLIGFDVSVEMLKKLKQKFLSAETNLLKGHHLSGLESESTDIIISTLTIAHIKNIEDAMQEWDRVLKPGSEVLITDYHPELLAKGGKRTFKDHGKVITVKNYIHPVEKLRAIAKQLYWEELRFTEREIDERVKRYYEDQNALAIFEKFKGTSVIYAIHLKKRGVIT